MTEPAVSIAALPSIDPVPADPRDALRQALAAASHDVVQGVPERLTTAQARQLRLAPWCYHASKAGSVYRQELAGDFAQFWRVQTLRENALAGLVQAWQAAGIEAVAIKGLALSRLVYAHPAARFSGDCDLLLQETDARRVRGMTVAGWVLVDPLTHEGDERRPFVLWHEAAKCSVDVHVSLLKQFGYPTRVCKRFTGQIWAASEPTIDWGEGAARVTLRAPAPADLLMVLATNRAWGDRWQHKPPDYLDMALTVQRYGLTPQALLQRATELGVRATWLNFLRHCNPFEQRFELAASRLSRALRWRKSWCTAPGGLPPPVRAFWRRALRAGPALLRVAQTVPTFLGVLRSLRHYPTPAEASAVRPLHSNTPHSPNWPVWQVAQAARWVCHLLRPLEERAGAGPCVVRSLTLFRLMQRHGHICEWHLGYRAVPGEAPMGHAWVQCEDPYALGLEEHLHNQLFGVVYRQKSG